MTAKRWTGRTDSNKRVVFTESPVLMPSLSQVEADFFKDLPVVKDHDSITAGSVDCAIKQMLASKGARAGGIISKGAYVIVKICGNRGHTLRGVPVAITTLNGATQIQL